MTKIVSVDTIWSRRAAGNVFETTRMTLPLLLGMAANAVKELANRAFLGRFSDSALAASLPGGMLALIFTGIFICTIGYSGTFVAQFHGAGAKAKALSSFAQGLWLALFSIPVFFAALPLGDVLIDFAGHAPDVRADEKTYFIFMALGGVFAVFSAVLGGLFTGQGSTRLVGGATAIGCVVNIALDATLIPHLGIAGAGIATVTGLAIQCLILGTAAVRDPLVRDSGATSPFIFRPVLAMRILRFGLPFGFSALVGSTTFTLFVMALGRLDPAALAIGNVCFAINNVFYTVLCAIESAVMILVGRYRGSGNDIAIRRTTRSGTFLAFGILVLFYSGVLPFSAEILGVFNGEHSTIAPTALRSLGFTFLAILFVREFLEAAQCVITGALRGAGDTNFVLIAHLIASVGVSAPLVLAITFLARSPVLLWLTLPISLAVHTVILYLRWRNGKWKRICLDCDILPP